MGEQMDNDKEYKDYLAGRSSVSQLYQKMQTDGPASQTDETILAAARREVDSKPRSVSPFGYRWMVPASLAAVLVLTVSIIMLQPPSIESTSGPSKLIELDENLSEPQAVTKEKRLKDDDKTSLAMNRQLEDKSRDDAGKKEEMVGNAIAPAEQTEPEQQKYAAAPKPAVTAETHDTMSSAVTSAPEKWLTKIEKLLNDNKKDEAKKEFKAFEQAFPDYQIDFNRYPNLKALVKTPE
jgi:hypothetical protein